MATKMLTYLELMNPTLDALRHLGGSATVEELVEQIIKDMKLSDEVTKVPHGKGGQTELEYRLAWARTYLKNFGLLENSGRSVWALTPAGTQAKTVDAKAVARLVREKSRKSKNNDVNPEPDGEESPDWKSELLETLLKMPPAAFERLCQRLLRESGFIEVEVTGRSGDGGIDGHGILRLAGMISFTVIFQAKRHRQNVSSSTVRDFRGAMVGRADKGVIISTAGFTRDAREEATRDGAPPIDLINGEDLAMKLKQFGLGVQVKQRVVEDITIDKNWFSSI